MKKIAVIGAESTGKSWLCEALAQHYQTVWVPEFARGYFNDSDIYSYTQEDLVNIAREQLKQEQEHIRSARGFLFCDTTLITLKIWAELEFKNVPPFIEEHLLTTAYTHYLITDNQVPWQKDELRQNKFSRDHILSLNLEEVKQLGGAFTLITGVNNERLQQAVKTLDSLFGSN